MAEELMTEKVISNPNQVQLHQRSAMHLPRSLSVLETWGFGFTGHLVWISAAPAMHAALGPQAIFVWLPATIVGILLNLQVRRLGEYWPEMAGGTTNYAARLLKNYPVLARYGAIAYFFGWAIFLPISALILTNLIKANLEPLGIACPETALKIGFTLIAFALAFSGTRALGILHLCFILPAVGFLLLFCLQGIGWLAFSPASPGFFPTSWSSFSWVEWCKWFFFAVYGTYACETASSFVADSRQPKETLRFLSFAAWLIPLVYLGGSWVLMRLATTPGLQDDTFLNLLAATTPFWGSSASLLVTLLLVSGCLLGCATAVSNAPRVLYQLALDGQLSPVFTVVSQREVLTPALLLSFVISLVGLAWGDVSSLILVDSTAYLASMMLVHLGLWVGRDRAEVRWSWWSLAFFLVEATVLVVGGLAWDWQNLLIGLAFPAGIMAVDAVIRRLEFPPFHPAWWIERRQAQSRTIKDFLALQVGVLIFLICSTAAIVWVIRGTLDTVSGNANDNLLIVLLITIAFVGVAIACWTSLPQVAAIAEARKQAERLFITALDTAIDSVLVLDATGIIEQANPAAEELFQLKQSDLLGCRLNQLLPGLVGEPDQWSRQSEQKFYRDDQSIRIIEVTLSGRSQEELQEYIVILRDITERQQAQAALQASEERFRLLVSSVKDYAIIMLDPEGHIVSWNAGAKRIQGYRTKEIIGQHFSRFYPLEDLQSGKPEDELQITAAEGRFEAEGWRIRKDGSRFWANVSFTTLRDRRKQLRGFVKVTQDITVRKQAEETLRESEAQLRQQTHQLEQALQELKQTQSQLIQTEKMSSIGQLVAGVAHEINNPVNFIYGNLTYVGDYTEELLDLVKLYQQGYTHSDPEVQDLIERIDLDFIIEDLPKTLSSMKVGTDRIREIVLTLRNFSRLDEAEMKPVDIHEGIDSTLLILQNALKEKPDFPQIEIVKDYGNLPLVECYAGQLNQVFMNILSNAIDALHQSNKEPYSEQIQSYPNRIKISTQVLNSDWVRISIKDNGLGMTESVKTQLFDPFFTTKPVGEGTGLGLSISYQIVVDKHGGQLTCISAPGEGAEFQIDIPISRESK